MTASDGLQILLVTPTGRDAELIANALTMSNVRSEVLKDVASAVDVFHARDIGAMLIAEEALEQDAIALLSSALVQQPTCSALPIIILTMGGKDTFQTKRQERQRLSLGETMPARKTHPCRHLGEQRQGGSRRAQSSI